MESPIATLELVEVAADGSRIPMRIELGQPRPDGRGTWACLVSVDGYDRHAKNIYGGDSLQALCLGMQMVRLHLDSALERGSRLVHPDGGTDFPLEAYFEEHIKPSAQPGAPPNGGPAAPVASPSAPDRPPSVS